MPNGGDIIITGGSVDLDYADSVYPKVPGDDRKHKNANRKITRILVEDEKGGEKFNFEDQGGLRWKVTVYTK